MLSLTRSLCNIAQTTIKHQIKSKYLLRNMFFIQKIHFYMPHAFLLFPAPLSVFPVIQKVSQIHNQSQPAVLNTNLIEKVNETVEKLDTGRLYAVVHLCGKQFKVTAGDIIIVEGHWAPEAGDKIKLEKV